MKKSQEEMCLNQTNKSPDTDPEEMEIYWLPDTEVKIIILNKLHVLQKDTDRQ